MRKDSRHRPDQEKLQGLAAVPTPAETGGLLAEAQRLVHELQVEKSELERQIEELRRVPDEHQAETLPESAERAHRLIGVVAEITERQQAEEELRSGNARLRLAYLAANAGAWEWKVATGENIWSDELWQVYGLAPGSCLPSNEAWLQTVRPEDRPLMEQGVADAARTGGEIALEWRVVDATGGERWLMSRGQPQHDHLGEVASYIGITLDITARKLAELELRQHRDNLDALVKERTAELESRNAQLAVEIDERKRSEELLRCYGDEVRDLYNNAPCGYHSLDEHGVFARINDTELGWLGYRREEIVGIKRFTDLVTAESAELLRSHFPIFVAQPGRRCDLELEMVRKDGSRFPIIVDAVALRDADGKYLMSRGTIFDNTERKKAEEERRSTEKRFRDIFENAPIGIFQTDPGGCSISRNPAVIRMFGYQSEQQLAAAGDAASQFFVHPEQRDSIRQEALLAHGYIQHEVEFRRLDGTHFMANYSLRAVHAECGMFMEGFLEDITAHKESEKALKRYARRLIVLEEDLRKRIAMELHDDVGQELTALNLNLAYIDKYLGVQSGTDLRPTLNDSRLLTRTINQTVRHLMVDLHPAQLDEYGLASAIRTYLDHYALRAGVATAVKVTPNFPRLAPKVEIALFRITQEALNNIAKYAAATKVSVALSSDAGSVRLAIIDDGQGFQLQDGVSQPAGSGWGLTIMRERAELAGGRFRFDTAPGEGTSLLVEIKGEF
jgi:PAS domain S-box-containing protein